MATIPSKRLPKWIAIFRGVPPPTRMAIHRRETFSSAMTQNYLGNSHGKSLWMRGVELIGMHVQFNLI